ncbi:ImmA/IrrE family metallo-endopeptidase [Scytonema hofmannii FACHB-248]|uniref:ImmA/IrrE family metallo-endopeptidase n=1 Tax=Scytonema hofmannii FACHB-248 TaxID=1842502 RepID=A0ABR8GKZ9_9CYAN|nr:MULTISPECIES: ImmA/IrrE family metallo-endopeptidase [Nostocales]MBD2604046.1 ImmA/IrrE family metallo-endopeptidase [Scytonema hofmannii FACHB-248]
MLNYEHLGDRLRLAREQTGMSQAEVAVALGITPAALSQYEKGKRRVEALLLETLSKLYKVPISYFFGHEPRSADWETALRSISKDLSVAGKTGISYLINKVHMLEDLYRRSETPFPNPPHPPFAAQEEEKLSDYEIAEYAQKARRHFDLGIAPILNLRGFLEAQEYKIFAVPLGTDKDDLSGFFFIHAQLGLIVVFNENQAYSRHPFTLAHELAHGLYHYNRPTILCRASDFRFLEQFAERFASYFLIPQEALHERLRYLRVKTVTSAEEVVHLARYFGVSFAAMKHRLERERRLNADSNLFDKVKPVNLAKALGYRPLAYEFGARPWPPEERLPRIFLELVNRALQQKKISLRRAAEMLGISDIEMEERFYFTGGEEVDLIVSIYD